MPTQILKKWGNSTAVRLPVGIMKKAKLQPNQEVAVSAQNGRIIIEPTTPRYNLEHLLSGITKENLHTEIDAGAPSGKEIW